MGEQQQGNNPCSRPVIKQDPYHFLGDGIAIPASWISCLEYSGAGLGIAGWLGVRQIGSSGVRNSVFSSGSQVDSS